MTTGSHYTTNDIIAAPATPAGRGAIAVIRCSGDGCGQIIQQIFDRQLPPAGSFRFGNIIHPDVTPPRIIDNCVLCYFLSPHSFTGEDSIELSIHGSPVVVTSVMECLNSLGVRSAEPGEFTLRAYLNGKIDLTQAEAVADLINSNSRTAAEQAVRQMNGALGFAINDVYDKLFRLLTLCTIELDFSEEDVSFASYDEKLSIVQTAIRDLDQLTEGYQLSRYLREGVTVAITGAPNVGKSSLFNALLRENRAIVNSQPGTTRDVLNGSFVIGGVCFDIYDTAGIRYSDDIIEAEGVTRALSTIRSADIVIQLTAPDVVDHYDFPLSVTSKIIKVHNKCDLAGAPNAPDALQISVKTGEGVSRLTDALLSVVQGGTAQPGLINRERHYTAIKSCLISLKQVESGIKDGQPTDIIAEELNGAIAPLNSITGRGGVELLLSSVFSGFCIGK